MANLLPLPQKDAIGKEYQKRRAIVAFVLLNVLALAALALLLPSYVASSTQKEVVKENLANVEEELSQKELQDAKEAVTETTQKLSVLKEGMERSFSVREVVGTIRAQKTDAVTLDGIFYRVRNEGEKELSVNGVAADRESLATFVDTLKEVERFNNVSLPISDFVEERDIPFSLSFTIGSSSSSDS